MTAHPKRQLWRRLEMPARRALKRSAIVSAALVALAAAMEFAQYVPEVYPGGHAVGEVVRNTAYGLLGAVLFNWIVVEVPARRRRRLAYDHHRTALQLLVGAGPALVDYYKRAAEGLGLPFDSHDRSTLERISDAIPTLLRTLTSGSRSGFLRSCAEIGVPRALREVAMSLSYFDPDVPQALARFPNQDGINVLQVASGPDGLIDPARDLHITWELLEASRRLYAALDTCNAYEDDILEGALIGDAPVPREWLAKGQSR